MSMTSSIELLEERIAKVNKKLFGFEEPTDTNDSAPLEAITERLYNINTLLNTAFSGKEKPNVVIKRSSELNDYLSSVSEDTDIPISAKAQLLSTMEPEIMENYKLLTQIQELMPVLESEAIKNVSELSEQFNKLSLSYLETYDRFELVRNEIYELLHKYHEVINSASEALIIMDTALTAAEKTAAAKKKPRND